MFACVRHSSVVTTPRLSHLIQHEKFKLVDVDLGDTSSMIEAVRSVEPLEVSRNLPKNSHLSLVIVCGIIFSLNSSNEYKVYFQSRQSAVIHQSEVQI